MRSILGSFAFLSLSMSAAHAQSSVVRGQVVLQGDGQRTASPVKVTVRSSQ
jgi:hypothetical protein